MKANSKVQSGNNLIVVFDGKQIGIVQSVRMNDSYGLEGAYGIGDINPQEHVPTQARYSLSVSNMVLKKGSMLAAGLVPENGDGALQGLVFDVEVYDKSSGSLVRKYSGLSYDSGDIDVTANRITVQSGQFMALNVTGTGA